MTLMTMRWIRTAGALAVLGSLLLVGPVHAQETKLTVEGSAPLRETLKARVGGKVVLRLTSGEEIGGTVRQVGDAAVQLSELSGREFYDAVVRLDHVSAVIVRVRDK